MFCLHLEMEALENEDAGQVLGTFTVAPIPQRNWTAYALFWLGPEVCCDLKATDCACSWVQNQPSAVRKGLLCVSLTKDESQTPYLVAGMGPAMAKRWGGCGLGGSLGRTPSLHGSLDAPVGQHLSEGPAVRPSVNTWYGRAPIKHYVLFHTTTRTKIG